MPSPGISPADSSDKVMLYDEVMNLLAVSSLSAIRAESNVKMLFNNVINSLAVLAGLNQVTKRLLLFGWSDGIEGCAKLECHLIEEFER